MLHPLRILRSSSNFTAVGLIGTAVNLPVAFYVANRVGPVVYGAANLVLLWATYASLVRLGAYEGGQRELIAHLGAGKESDAIATQNIAVTAELLWALAPASALCLASLLVHDSFVRLGLLIAPGIYLSGVLIRILKDLHVTRQHYKLVAAVSLVRVLVHPVLLLALLPVSGAWAILTAPIFADITGILVLWRRSASLHLKWAVDFRSVRRLVSTGFPLAGQAFVYWAYRLTGVTSIAMVLPGAAMGYYSFGARLIDFGIRPFSDFSGILTRELWAEMGRKGSGREVANDVTRITLAITICACLVANLAQAVAPTIIHLFVPKYGPASRIIEILALNVVLLTVGAASGIVLDSVHAGRQWSHLGIWVCGLAINAAANAVALALGGNIVSIAWNDIWVQGVVVILMFRAAKPFLFSSEVDAWHFYASLAGVAVYCTLISTVLELAPASVANGFSETVRSASIRLLIVSAAWAPAAVVILRRVLAARGARQPSDFVERV